ncbi:MAG: hypothetical protein QOF73_1053 [Thermomicrobiales bacterium]|nr:hypothetical protein [Thermomicrobiales bacterium]
MKLFAGLSSTDYQDVLRAIGAFIDANSLRDIRIWEHEDGLVLQARGKDDGESNSYQTYLLTDDDLQGLLRQAYDRRDLPMPKRLSPND